VDLYRKDFATIPEIFNNESVLLQTLQLLKNVFQFFQIFAESRSNTCDFFKICLQIST
jgi:hypothetical protein